MALPVGATAPDFSLPAGPGPDRVTLSSFRGEENVVLLFFPMAFSSVCTDEICQMSENYARWGGLDAQILGISVDSSFVVKKFREETGAPFPILSDFNKEAIHAFDVVYEDFFGARGVGKRSAFVVDKQGVIRYAWVTEDAGVLPDFQAIKSVVESLD